MKFAYLACLLVTIGCLLACDYRYKLAFFYKRQRTTKTIATAMLVFLLWDIAGIALDIFFPGKSSYSIGVTVLPQVPPEEFLFLFIFTYLALLLWRGIERYADLHHS